MTRRVALVTGGRRGIGRAIAERLASDGFDIVVADIAPYEEAGSIGAAVEASGVKFNYFQLDISDVSAHPAFVDQVSSAFGRIDCLVNNAGIGSVIRGDLMGLLPEHFDRVIDVNLKGTVFLTQAVLRSMLEGNPGDARSIVNITSVSAELASPERLDYCMSKAALSMWSKGLALRLAPEGISVFEVRPGVIRSEMTAAVNGKYDALIAGGLVPWMRWGEGSDIAKAVSALASGELGFSTGTIVNVDGGLSIGRL